MAARDLFGLEHEIGVLATDNDLVTQFDPPAGLWTGLDDKRWHPSPPEFQGHTTMTIVRLDAFLPPRRYR